MDGCGWAVGLGCGLWPSSSGGAPFFLFPLLCWEKKRSNFLSKDTSWAHIGDLDSNKAGTHMPLSGTPCVRTRGLQRDQTMTQLFGIVGGDARPIRVISKQHKTARMPRRRSDPVASALPAPAPPPASATPMASNHAWAAAYGDRSPVGRAKVYMQPESIADSTGHHRHPSIHPSRLAMLQLPLRLRSRSRHVGGVPEYDERVADGG